MPDLKISQFSDGGTIQTTDEIAANRGGTNTKVFVGSAALLDAGNGIGDLVQLEDNGSGDAVYPLLGEAAYLDVGEDIGDIPVLEDDGGGNPVYPLLGTASYADIGTDPSEIPLNSDLGTAAFLDAGSAIGDVLLIDDVDGNPGLPAIDGSQLTGLSELYANVLEFGAIPDGVIFYTADMTNGSPLLTGGTFTSDDVGKSIMVKGAGSAGADLVTTISTYVSPTSVNLSSNAATTVNDATCMYGTDNMTFIQDAIDSFSPFNAFSQSGGVVFLPRGTYYVSDSLDLTLKHGVWIVGESTKSTFIMSPNNDHIIGAIGSSTDITSRCGVIDLTIRGGGESLTASEGINFAWVNRGVVERVAFLSLRTCMVMTHQYQTRLEFSGAHGAGFDRCHTGLLMTETTLTNIDNAVFATNLEFQGLTSVGFRIMNGQGSKFVNCEAGGSPMVYGWWIGEPSTGTVKVQWMHFVNCLADSVSGRGWNFQKGTATELSEIQLANCWSGNVNDTNLEFVGCSDFVIDNFQIITSAVMGILLNGCTRVTLSNSQIKAYNANNTGSGWGILMQDTTHSKIIGTTFRSAFTSAPALAEGGTSNYNIISGNNADNAINTIGSNTINTHNIVNSVANYVIVTPWVAYTPTFAGFGTPTSVAFSSRRVGANLEILGTFVCGTSTLTEARVTIGFNGTSANVTSVNASPLRSGTNLCGGIAQSANTATTYYPLIERNVTFLTVGIQSGSTNALTKANASSIFNSGAVISVVASVPISGWA